MAPRRTQQATRLSTSASCSQRTDKEYQNNCTHRPPNRTGICTFDPGFTSTASCESAITFIDGNKGVLLYRGYPIEELAEKGDWTDACYLLLHGELPTRVQKRRFEVDIKRHTLVHEQVS